MRFFRRKPAPEPDPPKVPDPLLVPHAITAAPMVFLHYLGGSEFVSDELQKVVHLWLSEYVSILGSWIAAEYGMDAVRRADELTAIVQNNFLIAVGQEYSSAYQEWEQDFFRHVEREMGKND